MYIVSKTNFYSVFLVAKALAAVSDIVVSCHSVLSTSFTYEGGSGAQLEIGVGINK